jgi:Collagen triple helix repeat (20 copies)
MTIQSVTVVNGSAGSVGPPGPPGPSYDGTSITQQNLSVGPHTITTQTNLAYLAGTRCRMSSSANPTDNWMEGPVTAYLDDQLTINTQLLSQTRDGFAHSDWLLSLAGQPGQQGVDGINGVPGENGNVIWQGTAPPSGTNPASPSDGDWFMEFDPATPGGPAYLWGPYSNAGTPPWGTAGVLLATGPQGPPGATGATGPQGPTGAQGSQGVPGVGGPQGPAGDVGPAGPAGAGWNGTSTSNATIGAGTFTITTQPGLAYVTGVRARIAAYSAITNWVEGQVTAYSTTTGVLTINVALLNGSGTFNNWTVGVAGEKGQKGDTGAAGAGAGDMLSTNNLNDVADVPTSRNNLGLATVASSGSYLDLSNRPGTQRSVTSSPITVAAGDEILNTNITGAGACTLPAASTRNGKPVVFKDVAGKWGANNLTITPAGAEKIDGLNNIVGRTNYGRIALRPANDGVNTGWSLES